MLILFGFTGFDFMVIRKRYIKISNYLGIRVYLVPTETLLRKYLTGDSGVLSIYSTYCNVVINKNVNIKNNLKKLYLFLKIAKLSFRNSLRQCFSTI